MSDPSQTAAEPTETPKPPPRYRYATVLPSKVEIPVRAIRDLLPPDAWKAGAYPETISLPCSEVFSSPTPRIRLATLRAILPVINPEQTDAADWVNLPQAELALAYRTQSRRELLPPEPEPPAKPKPAETSLEFTEPVPEKPSGWKRLLKPILAKSQSPNEAITAKASGSEPTAAAPQSSEAMPQAEPDLLPEPNSPAAPDHSSKPESPKVPLADRPLENLATFQRLLRTDEELTLRAIPNWIAQLPGIRACRLQIHDVSLPSNGLPAKIVELASEARTALSALRKAGASSGQSLEPCLTIYDTSGPITWLEDGDATLLVFHEGRHFVPGVRETIISLLAAIASSIPDRKELDNPAQ